MTTSITAVSFDDSGGRPVVSLIDQRRLPAEEIWHKYTDPDDVAQAITDMVVRGAPAIGVTAAYGIAQAMLLRVEGDFDETLQATCDRFAATRPTAVNLFWAIERLQSVARKNVAKPGNLRAAELLAEARAIHIQDREACLQMGDHGADLLPDEGGVLTHCNTGALATGGQGTALGVIRSASAAGKKLHVWVDETRPYLQGARLTAWECVTDGLDATLITDSMAGHFMQKGLIQAAIVGSDRIAANGDVANKIGTYTVAVLCKHHGIPFYVAAPTSTIDLDCPDGAAIPIEQRTTREVSEVGGWLPADEAATLQIAPDNIAIRNPAFDVTPADLVDAIITERGVARPPFAESLATMVREAEAMVRQAEADRARSH